MSVSHIQTALQNTNWVMWRHQIYIVISCYLFLDTDEVSSIFWWLEQVGLKTTLYKDQTLVQWGRRVVPQIWTCSSRPCIEIFNFLIKDVSKHHQNHTISSILSKLAVQHPPSPHLNVKYQSREWGWHYADTLVVLLDKSCIYMSFTFFNFAKPQKLVLWKSSIQLAPKIWPQNFQIFVYFHKN